MLAISFAKDSALTGLAAENTIAQLEALGIRVAADESPPVERIAPRFGLPPSCVWFVTAQHADAVAARAGGLNVILIDAQAPLTLEPNADGLHHAPGIEDVLEIVRIPYTRSALNMRYIMRTVLSFD